MECNRDEALRAKEIAEKKFLSKDIQGAKKFAMKAQNLYPGLEGVSQMLSTFDVYLSAENKINGETNWYTVLSVNASADDETVKKQYRKLALILHPDKNKSVGADGAFKILSEAWSVLSDRGRRASYDQKTKRRASSPNKDSSVSNGYCSSKNEFVSKTQKPTASRGPPPTQSQPQSQPSVQKPTFWTACHRCKMQYEYHRKYLNHNLLCPNCHEPFLALETAPSCGSPHAAPWTSTCQQNPFQNTASKATFDYFTGRCSYPGGRGGGNTGYSRGAGLGSTDHAKFQWGAFSWPSGVSGSNASSSSSAATHAASVVHQAYEKAKKEREAAQAALASQGVKGAHASQGAPAAQTSQGVKAAQTTQCALAAQTSQGVHAAQVGQVPQAAQDGQTAAKRVEARKLTQSFKRTFNNLFEGNCVTSSSNNMTDMLKVERTMKKMKTLDDNAGPESGAGEAHQASSTKKNIPDAQKINGCPKGIVKLSRELSSNEMRALLLEKSKKSIGNRISEIKLEKEKREEHEFTSVSSEACEQHSDPSLAKEKKKYTSESNVDIDSEMMKPVSITYPDPEFHDFDKDRSVRSFEANQVWVAYDDDDGMPRYYALIQKVISLRPFKMRFSWLNTKSNVELGPLNWVACGFAKTCGEFRVGRYEICTSPNIFSHRVHWEKGVRGVVKIFPKKYDVWAIYKNWSSDWNETTPDEVIHKYEMVEVLEDYNEDGVLVTPLVKVAGFKTIFHRHSDPEKVKRIRREEMFQLSHQVPSWLLTGEEGQKAPKGCRELDPASTPLELLVITETTDEVSVPSEHVPAN